jgi:predicted RNA binding protein YcfA (HicA-like mRNA interferase family)
MNVRAIIKLLQQDRWRQVRMKGSHRQFKHPQIPGLVTVPGKLNDNLAPGTLNSFYKQAGWK